MFPGKKLLPLSLPLIILFISIPTAADWKDQAAGIKLSGGEDHTLVLTEDNHAWACGQIVDFLDNISLTCATDSGIISYRKQMCGIRLTCLTGLKRVRL